MESKNILIVGNQGNYGRYFDFFLRSLGYSVKGWDRGDDAWDLELMQWAGVVLFTVRPITELLKVMKNLLAVRPKGQLWIEIASRKEQVSALVRKYSIKNVLSIHPMRRPPKEGMNLRGSNIVVAGNPVTGEWTSWVADFLTQLGGEVTFTDVATHEELVVAYGQGLSHDILWLFVAVLWRRGIELPKLLSCSSPIFRILLSLSARMLKGDSELYAELQMDNSYAQKMLKELEANARQMRGIIAQGDFAGFVREFELARSYISEFQLKQLTDLSEKLVEVVSQPKV